MAVRRVKSKRGVVEYYRPTARQEMLEFMDNGCCRRLGCWASRRARSRGDRQKRRLKLLDNDGCKLGGATTRFGELHRLPFGRFHRSPPSSFPPSYCPPASSLLVRGCGAFLDVPAKLYHPDDSVTRSPCQLLQIDLRGPPLDSINPPLKLQCQRIATFKTDGGSQNKTAWIYRQSKSCLSDEGVDRSGASTANTSGRILLIFGLVYQHINAVLQANQQDSVGCRSRIIQWGRTSSRALARLRSS